MAFFRKPSAARSPSASVKCKWNSMHGDVAAACEDLTDLQRLEVVCAGDVEAEVSRLKVTLGTPSGGQTRYKGGRKGKNELLSEVLTGGSAKPPQYERGVAIQEYFEHQVAHLPEVVAFRKRLTGGRQLTGPEAWLFLTPPSPSISASINWKSGTSRRGTPRRRSSRARSF